VFNNPTCLAVDSADSIYAVDVGNGQIRKITKDGKISKVAGTGEAETGNIVDVGSLAVNARINASAIVALAVDGAGNIYIADNNANMIYKIDTAGILTAFAGNGLNGSAPDGAVALGNPLNGIRGMALLGNDVLYTEAGAVRLILADGSKNTVIAGALDYTRNVILNRRAYWPADGTRKALQLDPTPPAIRPMAGGLLDPRQIAVDGTNIIFWENSPGRYLMFTKDGTIKVVFGEVGEPTSGIGYRGDGIVSAPNTPRSGIAILPGPTGLNTNALAPFIGGDDRTFFDGDLGLTVIESGNNGTVETAAAGDDVQLVAVNSSTTIDYSKRNDDPKPIQALAGWWLPAGRSTMWISATTR